MITQDEVRALFEYRDGKLYWRQPRFGARRGAEAGTVGSHGYRQIVVDGKFYRTHRLIFLMHHGYLPKFIDHIDGNRSNDRVENLRAANIRQNGLNSKIRKDSRTGVKNVTFSKSANKFAVRLMVDGVRKTIGFFDDIELAELAAREARELFHKEFARHE